MNDTVAILEKSCCVGCRACEQSCPQKCISMRPDYEGFFYPVIDTKTCIHCGVCASHCPILSPVKTEVKFQNYYGVILKNKERLAKSSSGGAFAGIAEFFLKNDGVVYGASFVNDLEVQHIRITNLTDLEKLQGSKYIASNTENIFSLVKDDLLEGRTVLFSGCPCQIAGLRKYMAKDYPHLYTVDLVCHGTPSQRFFSEYVSWLEKKFGEKILYYGFRDKDVGGWSCGGKFRTRTRTRTLIASADPFYASFLRGDIYRESCYLCPFSNLKRVGDFTIGDLWGAKEILPEMYRKNGVSFILLNTEKATSAFEHIAHNFYYKECDIQQVAKYNHNLNAPTPKTSNRITISENIQNHGFVYALEHIKTKNYVIAFAKERAKDIVRFVFHIFERKHCYGR